MIEVLNFEVTEGTKYKGYIRQACPTCRKTVRYVRPEEVCDSIKQPETSFYKSSEWVQLRYRVLAESKRICALCGAAGQLHVDHIRPLKKYPELALDINNLQVLCSDCNRGKGSDHEHDWRCE